jgi:hypothetical protein
MDDRRTKRVKQALLDALMVAAPALIVLVGAAFAWLVLS